MYKIVSLILKGFLATAGRKAAKYILGFAFAAVAKAEKIELTQEEAKGLDEKHAKKALRNKKRETAAQEIKDSLVILDTIVPDAVINFFVELVVLAIKFELDDDIQKALS